MSSILLDGTVYIPSISCFWGFFTPFRNISGELLIINAHMSSFHDQLNLSIKRWVVGVCGEPWATWMPFSLPKASIFLFVNSLPLLVRIFLESNRWSSSVWILLVPRQPFYLLGLQHKHTLYHAQLCSWPTYVAHCNRMGSCKNPLNLSPGEIKISEIEEAYQQAFVSMQGWKPKSKEQYWQFPGPVFWRVPPQACHLGKFGSPSPEPSNSLPA